MRIENAIELHHYNGPIEFVGFTPIDDGTGFIYYKTVYGFVTEDTMMTDGMWQYNCYFPVDLLDNRPGLDVFTVNEDEIEWSKSGR